MDYIKEITVDLAGEMLFEYITAVQGDTARAVKITILSNCRPFVPPAGARAVIRCRKPDGKPVFNDASINEDGTITAPLTAQMLAAAGNCRCEVTLYGADEKVLTTVSFIVKVTPKTVSDNEVESTAEFTAIEKALAEVTRSEGVANAALEKSTQALNGLAKVEADIDAHTAAAATATERANTAANNAEQAIADIASATVTKYGVRFGGSANNGATVTRLHNAYGLVAGVGTDTQTAVNNFDNIYPWSARRRCCGYFDEAGNFVVNAYAGEPGYTTDGSNGEVWVEHSLFYYKHTYDGDAEEIIISAFPVGGFLPAPIFVKADGTLLQKAYTAAYPMAKVDGKATSRAGVFSDIYSLNSAMTAARTLGEDYTTTTTAEWYTECLYMWVEFATRNLQSVMYGAASLPYTATDTATTAETGVNRIIVTNAVANKFVVGQTIGVGTSLGGTQIASNRIVTAIEAYDADNKAISFDGNPVNIAVGNIVWTAAYINGSCDSVLSSSGSPVNNMSGKYNCVYRGKETPYGNSFEWISDVLFKREGAGTAEDPYSYDIYHLPDPTKYSAGTITADYVKLNFGLSPADGYVKKLGFDSRYPYLRLPETVGASTTTYYSDYYYYPRSAACAAFVGGSWNSGAVAGPCCWNCRYTPSTAGVDLRARLSFHRS